MIAKIKILLFYAIIIDGYTYYFGKNDPKAPVIGFFLATLIVIPGLIIAKRIKSCVVRKKR